MATEQGQVCGVHTMEEWHEVLKSAEANNNWLIVDFSASWCGPCRSIGPVFFEISKQNSDSGLIFVKIDVDELPSVAKTFQVVAMPTFVLVVPGPAEGEFRNRIVGANPTKLREFVAEARDSLAATLMKSTEEP